MKIAMLLPPNISGSANGIHTQARTWGGALEALRHKVDYISPWGDYNWSEYDIIHFFSYGPFLEMAGALHGITSAKIFLSPIIDTNRSFLAQRLASHVAIKALHMRSPLNYIRRSDDFISKYLARSKYEKNYLIRSFGVSPSRIDLIKLPIRFSGDTTGLERQRERFCLHVSILSSKNKNVMRLIQAAQKYDFKLVLAGKVTDPDFLKRLEGACRKSNNVVLKSYLTNDQLVSLYKKAAAFALPSLYEGVGLVALEAAYYGADVVLTNRGGPKEYYNDLAFLVDPLNVDEIGSAVRKVLDGESRQPALREHIIETLNPNRSAAELLHSYTSTLQSQR